MGASSTISKEDFEKLRDNLTEQWKTEFPGEEQPFQVKFNKPSEKNSTNQIEDLQDKLEDLQDKLEDLQDKLEDQWTNFLNQTCIQTSINNLTKRPNHTEG